MMLQKKKVFFLYMLLGLLMSFSTPCLGEEADDMFVPLDAVQYKGTINRIVLSGSGVGEMIIDDMVFTFSAVTEFFSSNKIPKSVEFFSEGQFVGFLARNSTLLTLWPEESEEGDSTPEMDQPEKDSSESDALKLENGVWVN